ncbi:ABC transporter ATP-binding protein [Streptomyces sp. IBSNAI002]|uniref:ABC transporter ATP-binding protein n=1 Tax=Streptomyces sp. IBSNAI002 TaxID=3457500 RepID=UPI003FD3ED4C
MYSSELPEIPSSEPAGRTPGDESDDAPAILLRDVGFSYGPGRQSSGKGDGADRPVLDGVGLSVRRGRFVSVVGPSGCGKSSLLNLVAGLAFPVVGGVEVFGRPVSGPQRDVGYVFQQDVLLPWKTLLQNVALGPLLAGTGREARTDAARQWLHRVGLTGFEDAYPHQVSGGMRRRAAIAQTWITDPDILLMDEPFGSVDVQTRQLLGDELLALWAGSAKTVLFVTHDLEEAVSLSDEVVVLSSGPASTVVSRFDVPLERPRTLMDIRTTPEFREIYTLIWESLREQVTRAQGRPLPAIGSGERAQ